MLDSNHQKDSLDLSKRKLHSLVDGDEFSFNSFPGLTSLNVSQNSLEAFYPPEHWLDHVRTLDLSQNNLDAFPVCLAGLTNLTRLDLSENKLDTIPNVIASLVSLTALNLSTNFVPWAPPDLSGLTRLVILDLRSNSLTSLHATSLPESLEELLLKNNQLKEVPKGIERLVNLRVLGLENNRLTSLPSLLELTKLTSVRIGGNNLTEGAVPEDVRRLGSRAVLTHLKSLKRAPLQQGDTSSGSRSSRISRTFSSPFEIQTAWEEKRTSVKMSPMKMTPRGSANFNNGNRKVLPTFDTHSELDTSMSTSISTSLSSAFGESPAPPTAGSSVTAGTGAADPQQRQEHTNSNGKIDQHSPPEERQTSREQDDTESPHKNTTEVLQPHATLTTQLQKDAPNQVPQQTPNILDTNQAENDHQPQGQKPEDKHAELKAFGYTKTITELKENTKEVLEKQKAEEEKRIEKEEKECEREETSPPTKNRSETDGNGVEGAKAVSLRTELLTDFGFAYFYTPIQKMKTTPLPTLPLKTLPTITQSAMPRLTTSTSDIPTRQPRIRNKKSKPSRKQQDKHFSYARSCTSRHTTKRNRHRDNGKCAAKKISLGGPKKMILSDDNYTRWVPSATDALKLPPLFDIKAVEDTWRTPETKSTSFFDLFSLKNLAVLESVALCDYESFFFNSLHANYCGLYKPDKSRDFMPFVASLLLKQDDKGYRTLLRTPKCDTRVWLKSPNPPVKSRDLKKLLNTDLTWGNNKILKLSKIKEEKMEGFQSAFLEAEQKFVGVIYGKKGQSSEIEMLGNSKNSEDFQDFLLFLGKIIPLKNWQKFDGGLDTSSDRTGKHSVYTTHEHVEIMFHVSTMLTDSEDDEHQHVAKKKFIGNDVVVIVFIEDDKPFSPSSKFNHVYIIVKPHVTPDKKRKFYRITVATRSETGDVHPILPPGLVYEQTSLLRRLLLTLIVNAENKVFQTGKFAEIKEDFRRKYLSSIYKDYSGNIKKSGDSGLSCFS